MKPTKKPTVGFYGISGCTGCLLTVLYEKCFTRLIELVDIKAFPFIQEKNYEGKLDYIFIEGTVCFDEDIVMLNKLRERTDKLVALGSCACFGCVPSMKNFHDQDKIKSFVYPRHNNLKETAPTPLDRHVKVDYRLPQCPPDKDEILEFIECIVTGREFKPYTSPVCVECRAKGNPCLLEQGKICLGPVTNGGCGALCPSNNVTCYGCRGPCKDANIKAFLDMLKKKGFTAKDMRDKMETFAGLAFEEADDKNISRWLED